MSFETTEVLIDDSGDTPRQAGDYRVVRGLRRLKTQVRLVLNWQRGEVDRHPNIGPDYQAILSQKNPDLTLLISQIRSELTAIDGITRIEQADASLDDTRGLEINVRARTEGGDLLNVTEYVDL